MFQHSTQAGLVHRVNPFKYIGSNRLQEAYAYDNAKSIHNVTLTKQFAVAPAAAGFRAQGENCAIIAEHAEEASAFAYAVGACDPQTHNAIAVGVKTKGSQEQRYLYRLTAAAKVKFGVGSSMGIHHAIPFYGYREEDPNNPDVNRAVAKYGVGGMLRTEHSAETDNSATWQINLDTTIADAHGGEPNVGTKTIAANPQITLVGTYLLFGILLRNNNPVGGDVLNHIGYYDLTIERIDEPDEEIIQLYL